jgi:hypothetical protein
MTRFIVSGRTWDHRDYLANIGGWWNNLERRWEFEHLSLTRLDELRQVVGLVITEDAPRINPFASWEPTPVEQPIKIGNDFTYYGYFADPDPVVFFGFDSLGAFVDHVASLERPKPGFGLHDKGWAAPPGFTGTESLADALDIARHGWLDGLGMMDRLLIPPATRKRRRKTLAGGSVSVGRMLAGQPNHMIARRVLKGRKSITVFVETASWIKIKADVLLVRSIAVAAIIDRLESEGYSCNLVAVSILRRFDGRGVHTAVTIKEAGERLNLADVSFAFGHPSFSRRLVHAARGVIRQSHNSDAQNYLCDAFEDGCPPMRNEFYIPTFLKNTLDIMEILAIIQPPNLPVKIEGTD